MVGQWCNWIMTNNLAFAAMYGTIDSTVKRAELTAFFLCFLKKVVGLTEVHVDNKGIIDGLWRGEMKCNGANVWDADL